MKRIGHEMILASAGAGKTYALTHRFVKLLAHGAQPERIVALTFTRKAAGEFFEEILKKLARAASAPGYARQLAAEIEAPAFAAADFLRLLRATVDAMPRLNLGTLDGFFSRVVQAFPRELGIDGEFQIMEATSAHKERRRVLGRMFAASGEPDAAQREFIEAFRRATFGAEEKRLTAVLDGFMDKYGETLLAAPHPEQWGEPGRIWPEGNAWLAAAGRKADAARELREAMAGVNLDDKQRQRLDDFFEALDGWAPGGTWPDPITYLVTNALKAEPGLTEIILEKKKVALGPGPRAALRAAVAGIAGTEIARRLEMTRGIYAVLRGYEDNYDRLVRRAGRLTFADVLRCLLPEAGAPLLGETGGGTGEARLLVDWRLDARYDHWLLDEFQDTSREQWSVLRNLIDEAVQDPEGRRSLFYVGDVKQAIFGWRGGDPALFREIFEHYNGESAGSIDERRLDRSWRSGPAVIAMVNRVFGAKETLEALLPVSAAKDWNREWREHVSARPQLEGFATLRAASNEADRFAATLGILREVEPARRGLDVAVLVQKNSTAAALADYLRKEGGLAAVAESDLKLATDNPVTTALLALLRAAAHPGDTLAREHVRMTPIEALLAGQGITTRDALTERVLGELQAEGFAGTLERWLRLLASAMPGDEFSAGRGRMLVGVAARFDESGGRDVAEFLEFAERSVVREADDAGVVRVMTIHKAKGLGFDVVILPDLEGTKLAQRREGLAVQRDEDHAVNWIVDLPPKILAERDAVLSAHVAAAESTAAYESLCLLYVAMTRAKRAMYLVAEPLAEKSTTRNFTRLLRETLGGSLAIGNERWFEACAISAEEGPGVSPAPDPGADVAGWVSRAARRPAKTPSAMKATSVRGGLVFALKRNGAADFGTAVHELFAEVEWLEPGAIEGFEAAWTEKSGPGDAMAEVLECLRAQELAKVWGRPSGDGARAIEVWRERAFEIVLDGAWVTGIFDRVVVERTGDGRASKATVIDFKTDRVGSAVEIGAAVARHSLQLNLYRRVVSALTGLELGNVDCELVFTRLRRRVTAARNS